MAMPTESRGADVEILQKVAEETGYNFDTLWKIYGYESSFGTDEYMNTGTYQGPFQFDKHLADSLGIDRYDLYSSAKAYVEELPTRKKSMRQNIAGTSGDYSFTDALESENPALFDYLLHQQGGLGLARIALAAYSGDSEFEGGSEFYMNKISSTLRENLSDEQVKKFDDKANAKEKIGSYIESTKYNLDNR
tara:strand:+ start:432 stop:1007 length:576 start_codon:yes stop_codon:yes gene_type:complete